MGSSAFVCSGLTWTRLDSSLVEWLDTRERLPPSAFTAACVRFSKTYGRFDWVPQVVGSSPARSYRIKAVDIMGRREYEYVRFVEVKLSAPEAGAVQTEVSREPVGLVPDALGTSSLLQLLYRRS